MEGVEIALCQIHKGRFQTYEGGILMKFKKFWILSVALLSLLLLAACSNGQEMDPEGEPTNIEMTPQDEPTNSEITPEDEPANGEMTPQDEPVDEMTPEEETESEITPEEEPTIGDENTDESNN